MPAWLALIGAAMAPAVAGAQPEVIASDELAFTTEIPTVFSASKVEEKVTEAPSYITIVTRSEIEKYGYKTLADVLRTQVGFYTYHDRNYTYLGVRGFGRPGDLNSRVLLLVNGHRVNDNIFDTAYIGTDAFIDLNAVQRVEIIRGPGSSLYGTDAFFAVINVITRDPQALKGVELSGIVASHETYKGMLSYGKRFNNGLEVFATGSLYDSEGPNVYFPEFDSPELGNGVARRADYDEYYKGFANVSYRDFTLQGGYSYRRKGIPTASYETVFGDRRNSTIDERAFVELKYERQLLPWLNAFGRVYYDYSSYDGKYVYLVDEPPTTPYRLVSNDEARGQWWGSELRGTAKVGRWLTVVAGGEFQHHYQQDQQTFDINETSLDDSRTMLFGGPFIQATFAPIEQIRLQCGVRYDHYSTFGGTTNPRCGLVGSPFQGTTLKALYGRAFRAPTPYELYYEDGGFSSKASEGLGPETIETFEFGAEQRFPFNISLTLVGFYNRIKDLIDLQTDPDDGLLQYRNAGDARAYGLEAALEGKWVNGLSAQLSYSYQHAETTDTDERLTNSPHHLAKANVIFPLYGYKLFGSVNSIYVSKLKTLASNFTDESLLVNATIFSQRVLLDGLKLSLSVFNLFDKRYAVPGSTEHVQDTLQQDGRTVWLEARLVL